MHNSAAVVAVRNTLQAFQDGYTAHDVSKLDDFMALFVQGAEAELIGIGASVRGGNEWFEGTDAIREIIESDWAYWGDVIIDVEGAKITVLGEVAWLSTTGGLVNSGIDKALAFYVKQMKELLEEEDVELPKRLMDATHFGMRRLWERNKGADHRWPFVLTAVLVREDSTWCFHTIHWAMPVD
jgi:hypothetical protein